MSDHILIAVARERIRALRTAATARAVAVAAAAAERCRHPLRDRAKFKSHLPGTRLVRTELPCER